MKELISAISQATANRVKSPILGSLILSWLAINHRAILTFFYSTPEQKIKLLQDTGDFWTVEPSFWSCPMMMSITYPVLLSFGYTFALPWLQHNIDLLKFHIIERKRISQKHRVERYAYLSQRKTSKAKAESNPDYWKEKLSRDLDKWEHKRSELESNLTLIRSERDSLQSQLSSVQSINNNLSTEIENLRSDIHDEKSKFMKEKNSLDNLSNELNQEIHDLNLKNESLYSKLSETESINKTLSDEISSKDEQIRLASGKYKEELEFKGELMYLCEQAIDMIESQDYLYGVNEDFNSFFKTQILSRLLDIVQPVKEAIKNENEVIKKAKLKAEIASKEKMSEEEISSLKSSLEELEIKDGHGIKLWE